MTVLNEENVSVSPTGRGPLTFLFRSCSPDPKGSVHRAWSVTMLLTLVFFILAIIEGKNLFLFLADPALHCTALENTTEHYAQYSL